MTGAEMERVDGLMERAVSLQMPGASLLMARRGAVCAKGYGYADVAGKKTASPDTKYMVASVTKQFTSLAVMRLAKDGLFSLSDRLADFFPELPSWAKEIEVRSLMNHTSGIPDYFDGAFIERYCVGEAPVGETLPLEIAASYEKLLFTPGSECLYSNSGYVLLGALVERLTGRSFAAFARERLLEPAGMAGSAILETGERPDGLAVGYAGAPGDYRPQPFNRGVVGWADGSLCSTVHDLYRWHLSLLSEAFLDKDDARALYSPALLSDGRRTGAGLGWFIGDRCGLREIWHTGSTVGYTSRISRFFSGEAKDSPEAVIILLCNMEAARLDDFPALFGGLAHILLDDLMCKPAQMPLHDTRLLEKLTGRFVSPLDEGAHCDVSIRDGRPFVTGSIRGFKDGKETGYIGRGDDGAHRFALTDGSDFVVGFDEAGRLYVDANGRMTYLLRREEAPRT